MRGRVRGAKRGGRAPATSASAGARPRLALTLGDPRGIGPEVIAKALSHPRVREAATYLIVGPEGAPVDAEMAVGKWPGRAGDAALAGRLAGLAVERATTLALDGAVDGLVTAPLDKAALLAGGFNYPGHTEMLAALTGSKVAMMLTSSSLARARDSASAAHPLRVVLATTHIPLRAVPDAVTADALIQTARTTRDALQRWFGVREPRIALCALNPHAGDSGRFGREDDEVLAPAARAAGVDGPFPADTVFVRALRGAFDAVIAPYHDVGMTAIKVASFGSAVNVTLGLPFPRCSPDHGTALDIAGQGVADPTSTVEAILLCAHIAARVKRE